MVITININKHWKVEVILQSKDSKLLVTNKMVEDHEVTREYDLPDYITSIEQDGEYVIINYVEDLVLDGMIQVKCQGDSELIIDKFIDDEYEDSIGCHDFIDDLPMENLVD